MSKQRIIIVAAVVALALGLGAGGAVADTGSNPVHKAAPVTAPRPVAAPVTTTTTTQAPATPAPAPVTTPQPIAPAPTPRPVAAPTPAPTPTTTTTTAPPAPALPPQPPAVAWQPGDQSGCAIAYSGWQTNPVNGQPQIVTGIYRGDCGEAQSIAAQYPGAVVVYNPDGTSGGVSPGCVGGDCTSPTMGG